MKNKIIAAACLAFCTVAARAQIPINLNKIEIPVALASGDRLVALANPAHYVASNGGLILNDTKVDSEETDTSTVIFVGKLDTQAEVRLRAAVLRRPGQTFLVLKNPVSYTGTPLLDYTVPSNRSFTGFAALLKIIQ